MKSLIIVSLLVSTAAFAAKTYQVTGPIVDITDKTITIDKKGEKFEIEKSAATKVTGELTKGSKATIYYAMTATDIEAKADKKSKK
jgi:hypothetical protein